MYISVNFLPSSFYALIAQTLESLPCYRKVMCLEQSLESGYHSAFYDYPRNVIEKVPRIENLN